MDNNLPVRVSQEIVEPIIVPPDCTALVNAGLNRSPIGVAATYDLNSPEGRGRAASILNRDAKSLVDLTQGVMHVKSITAEPCQWEDEESGELIQTVRIVFEMATGELVHTLSHTARQALTRIIWAFPPPWTRPLVLHFKQGRSAKKRLIYHLWTEDSEVFQQGPDEPDTPRKKK